MVNYHASPGWKSMGSRNLPFQRHDVPVPPSDDKRLLRSIDFLPGRPAGVSDWER